MDVSSERRPSPVLEAVGPWVQRSIQIRERNGACVVRKVW